MDYIQVSAKTVEDAVLEAAMKLATTRDHLEYEVIEKGSAGFLGFGAKNAVIKARALSDEEQLIVIDEIARIKGKTREKIFSFMLKQNKDVDYQNIPENDFNSRAEVDAWWKNKDEATIYKVFDEYYGIAEYIANEC